MNASIAIQVLPKVEAFTTESVNYYNVAAFLPGPVTAREGQFLRVAEGDDRGRVLAVEAAQVTLEPGRNRGTRISPGFSSGRRCPQPRMRR